jgi:cellulose synthase/poly-beta-1,6-N-acetylglucosamine synthase-like glycosyltransferase
MKYSVVIPAHNAERYLSSALESVRAQSLPPEAVIVVDDGSSDATAEIAASYDAVVIRHRIARGPSAARNAGVAACSTELVAFLDADDEWMPDHADGTVGAFTHPGVIFSAARAVSVGAAFVGGSAVERTMEPIDLRDTLVLENPIVQSGVVIRRDVFVQAGGYDESMRCAEDYDLWGRVAVIGLFCPVPATTVRRRFHPEQASIRLVPEMVAGAWKVRRRVAGRRLIEVHESHRPDVVQRLCNAGQQDLSWAVWMGDAEILSVVRNELVQTDIELDLHGRLADVVGASISLTRLADSIRCRAYGVRRKLRSHSGT